MPSAVLEKRCESGHIWSSRGALPRDLAGFLRRSPRWADHLGSPLIGPRAPLALATAPARPARPGRLPAPLRRRREPTAGLAGPTAVRLGHGRPGRGALRVSSRLTESELGRLGAGLPARW